MPKKMNKIQAIAAQRAKREYYLQGAGSHVYRNTTRGTLDLPKPGKTLKGDVITTIPLNGEWVGDDYFMFLVKTGMAALIRTITPIVTPVAPVEEEVIIKEEVQPVREEKTMEDKLILDQPSCVTTEGTVEHIVEEKKATKAKVTKPKVNLEEEVLLNDDPLDGVQILG